MQGDPYIYYAGSPLLGLLFQEVQEVCPCQYIQVDGYLIQQQHLFAWSAKVYVLMHALHWAGCR